MWCDPDLHWFGDDLRPPHVLLRPLLNSLINYPALWFMSKQYVKNKKPTGKVQKVSLGFLMVLVILCAIVVFMLIWKFFFLFSCSQSWSVFVFIIQPKVCLKSFAPKPIELQSFLHRLLTFNPVMHRGHYSGHPPSPIQPHTPLSYRHTLLRFVCYT